MATSTSSFSLLFSAFLVSLFVIVFSSNKQTTAQSHHLHHTIEISSLLPSSVCTPPTKGQRRSASSLKVVDRHGPCSQVNLKKIKNPTITVFFKHDQSRVNSIQSRIRSNSGKTRLEDSEAITIPAKSGNLLGSGNYFVTIGLGTPKKDLSLIFDTGSDLTWTQCQPCARTCYKQQETIFDPSVSKSYKNISCNTNQCSNVASGTGNTPGCSGSTCIYGIQYGDQSFSVGYFSTETLTLGSDEFPNFQFGCGQNNQGLFRGTAGLLGLGRDPVSLVSQTSSKYGTYFSYCLPSRSSSTGHLTLGKSGSSPALKFTPMSINSQGPSFYFIDIKAIVVGGKTLAISQSVFATGGTIIDSGTVITRLPPAAYTALRNNFRQQMTKYPLTQALSILDTCYDLSNYTTISIPKVSFTFGDNTVVEIAAVGILYAANGASQVCLAFAGNTDATDVGIFGNVQQKTLEVAYDVAGGKLGFGSGGCS